MHFSIKKINKSNKYAHRINVYLLKTFNFECNKKIKIKALDALHSLD